jgi:hypothetical protein
VRILTKSGLLEQYLICRGWRDRQIKNFGNPQGRTKNNNASILKHYPDID